MTEEVCENGLVYDGHGHVHNYCNYNWAVDCGDRVYDDTPISSPGCLYAYGIYPVGEGCQTTFFKVCHTKSIVVQTMDLQVWSLTQFYSVDFSKSRIDVQKCVFNKRTIKVCVSCC